MDEGSSKLLAAEQRARVLIDRQLEAAGWQVQDRKQMNLYAGPGIAVRESIMKPDHGRVDYLLYVDKRAAGVIEAKPEGTTLSGVEWQSAMYATGLPAAVRLKVTTVDGRLPFVFEASGSETHFTNGYDPDPRSRDLFNFPRPENLALIVRDAASDAANPTWRGKVQHLPVLMEEALRPAQVKAIKGLERSLSEQHLSRSLVQMATGAGKTFTAVTECYRLLKFGGFKRVLFLVDRNNLGDQTLREFRNLAIPDDGRRFTELYNVDKLTGAGMVNSASVVISTIQRVFAALKGQEITDEDDPGLDGFIPDRPVEVIYNAQMPPESFDLVIVDEAHRSIYGVWRSVLDYFDAHIIGLTATPGKQTFGFFQQNLVSEYTYAESVADNVNVDFDVYKIRTQITTSGSTIDAGSIVPKVDRRTRKQRYEQLELDLPYTPGELDRSVTSRAQIRLVLETFRDRLFTEIFPNRSTVPKTLILCKDDNHAEEVVKMVRDVFGKGNDFAAKITYRATDAKSKLQAFRTSATMRIAVTVDMIATGTDVKPLECLVFLRDVRSGSYFEQMKGRGARTISDTDFQVLTPDAKTKDRFVIVDAVGVTEHPFIDSCPLERNKSVSLKELLAKAAALTLTENETATLASRLAKLELDLTPKERQELDEVAGQPLKSIVQQLVTAVDPDGQAKAIEEAGDDADPDEVIQGLIDAAIEPIAANPQLRERIVELRQQHDQTIDEISIDSLLDAHGVPDTAKAQSLVDSWKQYIVDNRDEITALQVLHAKPQGTSISYAELRELADRIQRPPHNWTTELIWGAYETLESGKVSRARRTITDLVSLVRFTLGEDDHLEPYGSRVQARYSSWLLQQEQAGAKFTSRQRWWLDRIVEVIATSAGITVDDLENSPFAERGGIGGALSDLGDDTGALIDTLNEELAG